MKIRMRMMTTISALLAAARRVMPPSSFFERASWTLAPASLPRMPLRGFCRQYSQVLVRD